MSDLVLSTSSLYLSYVCNRSTGKSPVSALREWGLTPGATARTVRSQVDGNVGAYLAVRT